MTEKPVGSAPEEIESLVRYRTEELTRAYAMVREGEERLRKTNEELVQRIQELEMMSAEARKSRRAALNVLEDAVESRRQLQKEIAERTAAQEALRRVAEAHAFRIAFTDAIRSLSDAREIRAIATEMLGKHLDASRVSYGEFAGHGEAIIAGAGFAEKVAPLPEIMRIADYDPRMLERLRAGHTMVVSDVRNEPFFSSRKSAWQAIAVLAYVVVPLVKQGELVAALAVQQSEPRSWTEDEVQLIGEAAERTWDALERACAQEALRASEERSRALIANLPGGAAFIIDHEMRCVFAEGELLQAAGKSSEEFVGKHASELLGAEAWDNYETLFRDALNGVPFTREHDIGRRSYIARAGPLRKNVGGVTGVLVVAYDISERKEAEVAVREREEQFRRAIEDAPIPVIMHAEDGQVLQISRTWTELAGVTPEEVPTFDAWLKQVYGPGVETVRDYMRRVFLEGSPPGQVEFEIITRGNARRHWVFSASAPGRLRDGRRFAVGMAVDMTERKRAQEALVASEERLRLVIENARDYAIFSTDLSRRVTSWNAGAERLIGYSEQEIIGQSADLIFTAEDRAAGACEREVQTARETGRANDERWHLRKDGSRFWGSGMMMAMHDGTGAAIGFVKIFRDETAAREGREALERSREQLWDALMDNERVRGDLEAASRAKDQFFAVLSHELRTPLTPVLMGVDALMRRSDLPERLRDTLAMIRRNVEIEGRLIDDLLDVTRISRGKLEIVREKMDLQEAMQRAIEVSNADLEAKNQRLTVDWKANRCVINGDFLRLQQAFWNLLKNASKFTPEDGAIRVAACDDHDRIIVEVIDSGMGIEPEALHRIFNPFEQAGREITRKFGGLGLGLAISKATVEAHDGKLEAFSEGTGKGATFRVELPLFDKIPSRHPMQDYGRSPKERRSQL